MKTLHGFLITFMRATIPAHLTRLDLVILITSARNVVTTEDLKLENPGVTSPHNSDKLRPTQMTN
jgi:hypothetical protein